ncbi:unannotated protein [freshwater metagenome]|uniref:Unannotated protein n=1 Tax=freshwater metagenome TaxID=449393 RepID=A0A6J7L9E5_9ZZZZ
MLYTTSSVVIGEPSQKVTSSRRSYTQVSGSGLLKALARLGLKV